MSRAIVTTTIHVPVLLRDYAADCRKHGHDDLRFYVVGDRKTPSGCAELCAEVEKTHGLPVTYLDEARQVDYLARYPDLAAHLPWNSVMRRNVGHLMAYEEGAAVIAAIDDDNYVAEPDYMGGHGLIGRKAALPVLSSASGWLNVCDLLQDKQGREFFPRGFPVTERTTRATPKETTREVRVMVNAGLWLGDPDIDAVTRLAGPIEAVSYKRADNVAFDIGSWCSFNSQNTALSREVLPAWFMSPFVGRYDDIWASYIVRAAADHLGDYVAYGHPLVRQERNAHDYWVDMDLERMGLRNTEGFCAALQSTKLTGGDYGACTLQLLDGLEAWIKADQALEIEPRGRIQRFIQGYRIWVESLALAAGK